MTTASIRAGDMVLVDIRGERIYALVGDDVPTKRGELAVHPIRCSRGPRVVTSRQVVEHWRKRRARAS